MFSGLITSIRKTSNKANSLFVVFILEKRRHSAAAVLLTHSIDSWQLLRELQQDGYDNGLSVERRAEKLSNRNFSLHVHPSLLLLHLCQVITHLQTSSQTPQAWWKQRTSWGHAYTTRKKAKTKHRLITTNILLQRFIFIRLNLICLVMGQSSQFHDA